MQSFGTSFPCEIPHTFVLGIHFFEFCFQYRRFDDVIDLVLRPIRLGSDYDNRSKIELQWCYPCNSRELKEFTPTVNEFRVDSVNGFNGFKPNLHVSRNVIIEHKYFINISILILIQTKTACEQKIDY